MRKGSAWRRGKEPSGLHCADTIGKGLSLAAQDWEAYGAFPLNWAFSGFPHLVSELFQPVWGLYEALWCWEWRHRAVRGPSCGVILKEGEQGGEAQKSLPSLQIGVLIIFLLSEWILG